MLNFCDNVYIHLYICTMEVHHFNFFENYVFQGVFMIAPQVWLHRIVFHSDDGNWKKFKKKVATCIFSFTLYVASFT